MQYAATVLEVILLAILIGFAAFNFMYSKQVQKLEQRTHLNIPLFAKYLLKAGKILPMLAFFLIIIFIILT